KGSCYRVHPMIRSIHNEFYIFCDGAELANNELITNKLIVMSNVFFKLFSSINIIIVTVISYDNIRFSNYILYETNAFYRFIGVYIIWVRAIVHFVYLQLYHIKLVSYTSLRIIMFLTFFFLSSTLEI